MSTLQEQSIIIQEQTMKRCRDFAEQRLAGSSRLYKQRGEKWVQKIYEDIVHGTAAEFAVKQFLDSQGVECSEPDLTIYTSKQKSFNADLCSGGKKLHVKSQSADSAARHGLSWTFQNQDKLLWQPAKEDYVVFCKVKDNMIQLKAVCKATELLREELYVPPRIALYGATKSVIYYDELSATGIELWENLT